jgi:hypothetical protein
MPPQTVRHRSRSGRLVAGCLTLCAPFVLSAPAVAEPANGTHEQADHLFQEGLEGMRAGNYDLACPRLAASYRIDPVPGALFTLAECEARWQKLATALTHYQSFVSSLTAMSADRRETFEERRSIAAGQIAVLNVSAPEVTIDVAPNAPGDLGVKFQGVVVPRASYGVGRKIDPGSYSVTAESGNQQVWERSITLEAGTRAQVEVNPAPADTPAQATSTETGSPPADGARRTWIYVASGVAIAGAATGLVAGALAYGQKGSIDDNCPALACNSKGRAALDSARAEARVSTVGFSFGVAGAIAAVVLLSLAPDSSKAARASAALDSRLHFDLGRDGNSIDLTGEF